MRRTATLELRAFWSEEPARVEVLGSAGGAAVDALVQSSRWHMLALRVRRPDTLPYSPARVNVALNSDYFTEPEPRAEALLIDAELGAHTSAAARWHANGLSQPLGVLLQFANQCVFFSSPELQWFDMGHEDINTWYYMRIYRAACLRDIVLGSSLFATNLAAEVANSRFARVDIF